MITNQLKIVDVRILLLSPIKDVGSKKIVGRRYPVIYPPGGKILIGDLLGDKSESAGISGCRGTRERKQVKVRHDLRVHGDVAADENPVVSVLRRHRDGIGLAETLAQAFVIGKKEGAIFDDRSTAACAELVALERRDDQIS